MKQLAEVYANGDYIAYLCRNHDGYGCYKIVQGPTGEIVADIPGATLGDGEHVARIMCDALAARA